MKKKKRLLSLLTALCMLLTMFPLSGITAFAVDGSLAGSGTADDPYQIADAADLSVPRPCKRRRRIRLRRADGGYRAQYGRPFRL